MASNIPYDDFLDDITCDICSELYNQQDKLPKLLSCGHTVCKACIFGYLKVNVGADFNCPFCDAQLGLRKSDVEKLKNNMTVISLMDKIPMGVLNITRPKVAKSTCKKHNATADSVCLTCKLVLCTKCFAEMSSDGKENVHSRHDIKIISDVCKEQVKILEAKIVSVEESKEKIIDADSKSIEKLKKDVGQMKKEVRDLSTKGHKRLDDWERELIKEIDRRLEENSKSLSENHVKVNQDAELIKRTIQEHLQELTSGRVESFLRQSDEKLYIESGAINAGRMALQGTLKIELPQLVKCASHSLPSAITVEGFNRLTGNQPKNGKMQHRVDPYQHLPGYPRDGMIIIDYHFPDGYQGEDHPEPGARYKGAHRTAYLPDNVHGRKVLMLLKKAFDARLVFTVGRSVTSGTNNIVTWNDIHHKTQIYGGAQGNGYPDPDYLRIVEEALAAKGITE